MRNVPLLKEINYANKFIESTPLKEKNMCIKMEYSSKTVNELRNIARDRVMVGHWNCERRR